MQLCRKPEQIFDFCGNKYRKSGTSTRRRCSPYSASEATHHCQRLDSPSIMSEVMQSWCILSMTQNAGPELIVQDQWAPFHADSSWMLTAMPEDAARSVRCLTALGSQGYCFHRPWVSSLSKQIKLWIHFVYWHLSRALLYSGSLRGGGKRWEIPYVRWGAELF